MARKLILIFAGVFMAINAAAYSESIKVNTIGYKPLEEKFVVCDKACSYFAVYDNKGKKVFSNDMKGPVKDAVSGDECFTGNFTQFKTPGVYYIEIEKAGRSAEFEISDSIYDKPFEKVMHAFYQLRCGIDIKSKTGFEHKACHLNPAEYHETTGEEGEIDVNGGWHDAGDYGKYAVNSGISTGTLILMFERYKNRLENINTGIPAEQKIKKLPDVLNEIKWNLDWMLKMQAKNGGVYHKATPLQFPPLNIMPEDDKNTYFVYEITSTATADFAAVMAAAARVFKSYDSAYADKCLKAAEKAWGYLEANLGMVPKEGYKNPDDTKTGQYGDNDDKDERLWAAAELFSTTGKDTYNTYFTANYKNWEKAVDKAPSWREVKEMAMVSYCMSEQAGKSEEACASIKDSIRVHCDTLMARINENGYRNVMSEDDYVWGSNSVALNYAINLISGAEILAEPKYKKGALEILGYIFGINPFARSYVTGIGGNYPLNIHHRPSAGDKNSEPWPGLLAGGPNKRPQDNPLRSLPFGTLPARSYADHVDSYASNEIAINWNAPLAFVLAEFISNNVVME
ncbi:MAG TPA: glycoside hydrolase family 9 protein, partial [Candidatus Goldiibacteriota bacterium]|nr:glycoside hydrolase family 9 protein [Candidatus Goldiibacteriota bacterium]